MGAWYNMGKMYIPGKGWVRRSLNGSCLTLDELKVIQEQSESKNKGIYSQEERERESAKIYVIIANEIRPKSIKMKEDISWNHDNNLLPILDTQMGIRDVKIVRHHFSKKMSSLEVVLGRPAISMGSKLSILVQEGCGRVQNCSV